MVMQLSTESWLLYSLVASQHRSGDDQGDNGDGGGSGGVCAAAYSAMSALIDGDEGDLYNNYSPVIGQVGEVIMLVEADPHRSLIGGALLGDCCAPQVPSGPHQIIHTENLYGLESEYTDV
ncbi:hypothetical protein Tco_0384794 [Tanacetum coccineum]